MAFFGGNITTRAKLFYITSEFKLTAVIALWALAHRLFPSVPIEIAPIDLTAMGLGTIIPSLGTLGVYVIGRCVVKGFTPGSVPFLPDETEVPA